VTLANTGAANMARINVMWQKVFNRASSGF
jgi:hypothetical protein